MTITALTDPNLLPNQDQDQQTYDNNVAYMIRNLPLRAQQENELAASVNNVAAGTAYSIPYVVDLSTTTDADPTAGRLRFNAVNQNAATTLFADLAGADTVDYTSILDQFDASTSVVKGQLRIVKQVDAAKFLTFDVMARTTASGYRKLTVTNTGGSSANPFGANDPVVLKFTRTGDKGTSGVSGFSNMVVLSSTQTWVCPSTVSKAEVTIIDGGMGGSYSSGGTGNNPYPGGKGGAAGISVLSLVPNSSYTATVGAGSATSQTPGPGGASSFAGSGITTMTSANAALIVPGGPGGIYGVNRGGTLLSPPGASGYGAGGLGGNDGGSMGTAGNAGVVIIRY
jgi:hypothetical protein